MRRVRPGDALTVRDLRLRALADAPFAFSSTLAAERRRSDAWWRQGALVRATSEHETTYLLESAAGAPLGLAGAYRHPERPEVVHVVSVWVDPSVRGRGAGRLLLAAVSEWARTLGARTLELWVTEGNVPARRLYERLGFAPAGPVQPLPSDPAQLELLLQLPLDADPRGHVSEGATASGRTDAAPGHPEPPG